MWEKDEKQDILARFCSAEKYYVGSTENKDIYY